MRKLMMIVWVWTLVSVVGEESKDQTEVEILQSFKALIISDPNQTLVSWNESAPSSPCSWVGIACEDMYGFVVSLQLPRLGLVGTISAALGFLTALTSLDLSDNYLMGNIPPGLFQLCNLQTLNLSRNSLLGTIPYGLIQLQALSSLDLSLNNLSGVVPYSLGNLPSLQYLNLTFNRLEGTVPDTPTFRKFSISSFFGNPRICVPWVGEMSSCHVAHAWGKILPLFIALVILTLVGGSYWKYLGAMEKKSITTRLNSDSDSIDVSNARSRIFTTLEIAEATGGFDPRYLVGEGVRSEVFKGSIQNGKLVVVKRLKSRRMTEESKAKVLLEWKMLARVKHPSLVKVLGWCNSPELMALVLDFYPNGNLEMQMHQEEYAHNLFWLRRLNMAVELANGLAYLHKDGQKDLVLRCDIQPSTILLDEKFDPHLCGFSVVRHTHTILGTSSINHNGRDINRQYRAPGMKPTDFLSMDKNLPEWVSKCAEPFDVVDPAILETADHHEQIVHLIEIALRCTQKMPQDRPTMQEVTAMLHDIMTFETAIIRERRFSSVYHNPLLMSIGTSSQGMHDGMHHEI